MKRLLLSSFILSCLSFASFSQTVSDFTVTDLDGETHTLYSYLDAGKYVFLKFTMFD